MPSATKNLFEKRFLDLQKLLFRFEMPVIEQEIPRAVQRGSGSMPVDKKMNLYYNAGMKNLPIGIQTFSHLMEHNYLYVDKTEQIHRLLALGGKFYFLSRPRRFGKSLLISTLTELFSGNRELFKDLWIYDKIEWKKYPVIHIDFLEIAYETPQKLKQSLGKKIREIAGEYDVEINPDDDYKEAFRHLIKRLAKTYKTNVVILVDEYDKPIIDFIETEDIKKAKANRNVLKYFYSVLKSSDQYIRFAFITGVSKFSRVSIFSDVNNLNDITIDNNYSTLLGLTHDELLRYFENRIDLLSRETGPGKDELLRQIKMWYNGYSWDGKNFLYNPFSILNLFSKKRFSNYWFSTGTPTFLINLIKKQNRTITSLEREEVDDAIFETYDIENLGILSMLFQTGYLTIKEIQPVDVVQSQYILSYPNLEVKESFLKHFLTGCTTEEPGKLGTIVNHLVKTIRDNEVEKFFTILKSLFASIPSHLFIAEREAYYHTVFYLILTLIGIRTGVEVHTNKGRIDAAIETDNHIYVMEFKMGTAAEAMDQIEEKKYYEKYLAIGKPIHLIGVGFDAAEKNIVEYMEKQLH